MKLVGALDLDSSAFFLLVGIQQAWRLMPNERAALSSQKTQNKQDEVIETTAVMMMMMMMAPLIGLQLTQPQPAPLLFLSSHIPLITP